MLTMFFSMVFSLKICSCHNLRDFFILSILLMYVNLKRLFMDLNMPQGPGMINWKVLYCSGDSTLPDQTLNCLFNIWQGSYLWFSYILIIGSSVKLVERVFQQLGSKYTLKDLGEFKYFLGLEVTPSHEGIHLSQTKYIGDLLKKA